MNRRDKAQTILNFINHWRDNPTAIPAFQVRNAVCLLCDSMGLPDKARDSFLEETRKAEKARKKKGLPV